MSGPGAGPPPEPGALEALLGRGLVRAGLVTYLFSGLTLVANLVTGITTARALGPDGRGVTVALLTISQLAALLFAMGVAQSLSYFVARRPEDGPSLVTTWALMLIPLSAVAVAVSQLVLPALFAGDDADAVAVGRWFLFAIVLIVALELNYGVLLGIHDFFVYNVLRLLQPALAAVALVALWQLDALTVDSALIAAAACNGAAWLVGMVRVLRRVGVGPPAPRLGLTSLWYGIRGQGTAVAPNVTARLDVALLPAYVSAAAVGIYSVATNVSLIVYQLAQTFAGLVLPAAAREPERGPIKVVGSLWGSLAVAAAVALALAAFARPLLGLVYGEEFREAAEPLWLLLPGAVLFAGSSILSAGIYAAGRPFVATLAQLLGMGVTIVGLFAFLPGGGIRTAALVSSTAYATVFVATLVAYKRVEGLSWRGMLPTPRRLRTFLGA